MPDAHQTYLNGLPDDWAVQSIETLGEVVGGSTPSRAAAHLWGGEINWVTPGELTSLGTKHLASTQEKITEAGLASCGAQLLPPGTLLVTSRATLGAVAVAIEPTATNQGFKSIVFSNGYLPDFYYHLFQRLGGELARRGSGTTFLEVPAREFKRVELPVPPLPEQRRIAEILDTVDEAIRKTEEIIAKLKQVKQGLLHDLLTRGIDENGELRDPDRHPDQFNDSPLGGMPSSWGLARLEQVLESSVDGPFGSNLKTEHYVEQPGVRVVRLQNIGEGEFLDHEKVWVSEAHAQLLARHEVRPGDVLVACLGDPTHMYARACEYPPDHAPGIVKADCFRLRPTDAMSPGFLAHALNCHRWRRDLAGLAHRSGVSRDRINLGKLRQVRVPVPPRAEQRSIARIAEQQSGRIQREVEEVSKLRLLKQGLMEDLLTGRVRVTALLEEAAE